MKKESSITDQVANHLLSEKTTQEQIEKSIEVLYSLRCFEIMKHQDGVPLAMRVPGGWIFYVSSGGGALHLETGEDDEKQQVFGRVAPQLTSVFVPWDNEFLPKRNA